MPNLVLASCMLIAALGTSISNVALPTIMKFFASTIPSVQLIILSYLLSSTISIIFIGRLSDHYGHRKILLFGLGFYSVSALVAGLSTSFWFIVFLRALQGLGSAALMAMAFAMVTEIMPKNKVGRAVGLIGSASAFGTACGPSLGGILLQFNWPAIFFFMGGIGIVIFILVISFIPNTTLNSPPVKFTFRGNGMLSLNLLMNAIVAIVMMSTLVVGPFYLNLNLGLTVQEVGLVMTVGPLVSIISGIPAGKIADKYGHQKVLTFGLIQLLLGSVSFTILPLRLGIFGYILSSAILSMGYQLFQAANSSMLILKTTEGLRGSTSGLLSFSRNLGLIAGVTMMSFIFHRYEMQVTFIIAAALALMALLLAFKLKS